MYDVCGPIDRFPPINESSIFVNSFPSTILRQAGGGCATKRRACKGCSCGRAEMEMSGEANGNGGGPPPGNVVSIGDVDDALTSACGNCSKVCLRATLLGRRGKARSGYRIR